MNTKTTITTTPAEKAAFTRKFRKLIKSDAFISANYELRHAEASLAHDTRDAKRIARLEAAQKAMSDIKSAIVRNQQNHP